MSLSKEVIVFVLLSLLLISATASRQINSNGSEGLKAAPDCDQVYGAEDGDTCTDVATKFDLTLKSFLAINPNINCADFFVGQWLCVDGTA
ncbi:hypothetical protein M5689_025159 [Euphorbia peplus]|nr:hypothetical protein M5689_025159 [Euphorbia peplus]